MMPTELTPAAQPLTPVIWPEIEFGASDRILILSPHPDDESLACGGSFNAPRRSLQSMSSF
jgi:hypothetical protein